MISVVKRDNVAPRRSKCWLRHAILNKTVKQIKQVTGTENERKKRLKKKTRNKLTNKERFVKTISKL